MRLLPISLLALVVTSTGCQVWEPVDAVPGGGQTIRIVTTEGTRLTLEDVTVRGDTLVSEARSCAWTVAYGRSPGRAWCGGVGGARADVVRVEVPRGNAVWRTFLIVLLGFFAGALAIGALELLADGIPALTSRREPSPIREGVPSRR